MNERGRVSKRKSRLFRPKHSGGRISRCRRRTGRHRLERWRRWSGWLRLRWNGSRFHSRNHGLDWERFSQPAGRSAGRHLPRRHPIQKPRQRSGAASCQHEKRDQEHPAHCVRPQCRLHAPREAFASDNVGFTLRVKHSKRTSIQFAIGFIGLVELQSLLLLLGGILVAKADLQGFLLPLERIRKVAALRIRGGQRGQALRAFPSR